MKFSIAADWKSRLKGLLGTQPSEELLLLTACKSIHTFGMRYELDIAFIDETGLVLASYRRVPKRKILSQRRAKAVLERAYSPALPWLQAGQQLRFTTNGIREKG